MSDYCSVEGCDVLVGRHGARGLCSKHYKRWRARGRTDLPSAEERFWSKVDKNGPVSPEDGTRCWLWTAYVDKKMGYGRFGRGSRSAGIVLAHRFAYELVHGPISIQQLDHRYSCSKHCVNPTHLRLLDPAEAPKLQQENLAGAQANNRTSGIRGVHLDKRVQRWRVEVGHNGKLYYGGSFPLEQLAEAEIAAIALRNQLFTHNDADRV